MICLALRHLHFEDLGLFADPLRARGYTIRYVDTPVAAIPADEVCDADLLVVLGGPVGVAQREAYPWLATEIDAVATRLAAGRPTLGVCLGAQMMAAALGAEVVRASAVELGWGALALSAAGRASPLSALDGLPVLHWHGDRFELPPRGDRSRVDGAVPAPGVRDRQPDARAAIPCRGRSGVDRTLARRQRGRS